MLVFVAGAHDDARRSREDRVLAMLGRLASRSLSAPSRTLVSRRLLSTQAPRTWRVYLSGEIHSNWRDVITDGTDVLVCDEPGAPKRCGGLGDVLCGALAPLAAQAARADAADAAFVGRRPLLWACYGACVASRRAAAAAFARKRRAMTAPDALAEIGGACESVAPTTVVEPPS